MTYKLSKRSKHRLRGIHPDLVRVVDRAISISDIDFTVLEGLRSIERQVKLVKSGTSKTVRSRHITGHAVDLGVYVDGKVCWDFDMYQKLADTMKKAAKECNVLIEWGGDWNSLKDGPHFQLPYKEYPA